MTFLLREVAAAVQSAYARYGLGVKVTSTTRSWAEQDRLYYAGRTKLRGGQSLHNYGLAFDVVPGNGWPDVPLRTRLEHLAAVGRLFGLQAVVESDHTHLEFDPRVTG